MAKKNGKQNGGGSLLKSVPGDTVKAIAAVVLIIVGAVLALAGFGAAGPAGADAYILIGNLLGVGYFLVPILFFVLGGSARSWAPIRRRRSHCLSATKAARASATSRATPTSLSARSKTLAYK
jgi:hypothetical protein